MSIITYSKLTGDIVCFLLSATESEFFEYDENFGKMVAEIPFGATNFYVKNQKIVEREPKPSSEYVWDGEKWVIDLPYANQKIRLQRNELLAESDWTDTLSSKTRLGEKKYGDWQKYRQELRDITKQAGFPLNIIWPEKPV